MENSNQRANVNSELARRHAATARTVVFLLIGVVLLCIVAFFSKKFISPQSNPSLDIAVRISILILGLGSVVLRRTRFSVMRLQDIGGLRGPSGLLATLQRTTLQVALLAVVIALTGFAGTLLTANDFYTYAAAIVALAVLLYAYPVRRSWEAALRRFTPENTPSESASTV